MKLLKISLITLAFAISPLLSQPIFAENETNMCQLKIINDTKHTYGEYDSVTKEFKDLNPGESVTVSEPCDRLPANILRLSTLHEDENPQSAKESCKCWWKSGYRSGSRIWPWVCRKGC